MVDVKKIKALMGANDHTKKYVAEVLGLSDKTFANRLNGESEFKAEEIYKIAQLYGVELIELYE